MKRWREIILQEELKDLGDLVADSVQKGMQPYFSAWLKATDLHMTLHALQFSLKREQKKSWKPWLWGYLLKFKLRRLYIVLALWIKDGSFVRISFSVHQGTTFHLWSRMVLLEVSRWPFIEVKIKWYVAPPPSPQKKDQAKSMGKIALLPTSPGCLNETFMLDFKKFDWLVLCSWGII